MIDSVKVNLDKLALEFANRGNEHDLFQECPRNVKNPGLWFGFQAGYAAALLVNEALLKETVEYCAPYTHQMWAATIVGILLECDFRDSPIKAKKFLKRLENHGGE